MCLSVAQVALLELGRWKSEPSEKLQGTCHRREAFGRANICTVESNRKVARWILPRARRSQHAALPLGTSQELKQVIQKGSNSGPRKRYEPSTCLRPGSTEKSPENPSNHQQTRFLSIQQSSTTFHHLPPPSTTIFTTIQDHFTTILPLDYHHLTPSDTIHHQGYPRKCLK